MSAHSFSTVFTFLFLSCCVLLAPQACADQVDELNEIVLTSNDTQSCLVAMDMLGEIGDARAVEVFKTLLSSGELQLQYAAIKNLGHIGSREAKNLLGEIASAHAGDDLGKSTLVAMAIAKDAQVFSEAEQMLASEQWSDRWFAVLAFDLLGDKRAEPLLEKMLTDSYQLPAGGRFPVREAAQTALDHLRSSIEWSYSFTDGQVKAKLLKKPLLVYFFINGGEWCEYLEQEAFENPEIRKLFESFIAVRINAYVEDDVSKRFNIKGTPTILLMHGDGQEISRLLGYITLPRLKESLEHALAILRGEHTIWSDWIKAQDLVERGAYEEALPLLAAVLAKREELDDHGEWAQFMAALSYGKLNKYAASKEAFEIFIQRYQVSKLLDKAYYCLSLTDIYQQNYAGAKKTLTDFLARFPESSILEQVQLLLDNIPGQAGGK